MFRESASLAEDLNELSGDELQAIIDKFGLDADLPEEDSEAFSRLIKTFRAYADAVEYQSQSPRLKIDKKAREGSDTVRRNIHNQLCIMLLGTDWNHTDKEDRDRISNIAVTVGEKPEFINQF